MSDYTTYGLNGREKIMFQGMAVPTWSLCLLTGADPGDGTYGSVELVDANYVRELLGAVTVTGAVASNSIDKLWPALAAQEIIHSIGLCDSNVVGGGHLWARKVLTAGDTTVPINELFDIAIGAFTDTAS